MNMSDEMRKRQESMGVFVGGRRGGKTTKCLEWLEQAKRVPQYPFWDRILLTPSLDEAQRLRVMLRRREEERNGPEAGSGLYYNLVYSFEEWRTARLGLGWQGEVAVDNAEWIIEREIGQRVSLMTMTGTLVTDGHTCTWTRCNVCPRSEGPCACSGGPCGECGK